MHPFFSVAPLKKIQKTFTSQGEAVVTSAAARRQEALEAGDNAEVRNVGVAGGGGGRCVQSSLVIFIFLFSLSPLGAVDL
jgi:hypothetical protein